MVRSKRPLGNIFDMSRRGCALRCRDNIVANGMTERTHIGMTSQGRDNVSNCSTFAQVGTGPEACVGYPP